MSIASIALAAVIALAGCNGANPVSPGAISGAADPGSSSAGEGTPATATRIALRFDQTAEYRDLALRWLDLEDSRCPTGVTCVWAGQIVATVEVARGDEGPVELELLLRIGDPAETKRAFDHELRLLGVDPHPRHGVTPERETYVAHIEISEP